MLWSDYPIFFNETQISIKCWQWDRYIENVVNVNQTEAGTDSVEVVRRGKSSITAAFQCSDKWASILAGFSILPSFTVKFYDVISKTYIELTVRMENFCVRQVQNSEMIASNGVYYVGFDLVEY